MIETVYKPYYFADCIQYSIFNIKIFRMYDNLTLPKRIRFSLYCKNLIKTGGAMSEKRHKQIRHLARLNTIGLSKAETKKEIKLMKRELKASRHPRQGMPKRKAYFSKRGRAA